MQLNVCGMDKVLCGLAGVAESCSVWEWITTDEKPYSRPLILFFRLSLYVCMSGKLFCRSSYQFSSTSSSYYTSMRRFNGKVDMMVVMEIIMGVMAVGKE